MKTVRPGASNRFSVEIISDAVTISISYDRERLIALLANIVATEEMRRLLKARKGGRTARIFENCYHVEIDGRRDRYFNTYDVILQKDGLRLDATEIRHWSRLARKLGLDVRLSPQSRRRAARRGEEYVRSQAPAKLVRALRQFMFEALYAAAGRPLTEEACRELEEIGTMVGKCGELRVAGEYSAAAMRRGPKSDFEWLLRASIIDVAAAKRRVTYESVASRIQHRYKCDPVLTGETLRKIVAHHGLNWKEMKKRKTWE